MNKFQVSVIALLALIVCAVFGTIGIVIYANNQTSIPITPQPTSTPELIKFEGEGDKVLFFENNKPGMALFGSAHRGKRNFIVELSRGNGQFIELVANTIGDYEGEKAIRLDKGQHIIEVQADGQWFVIILPPQ